MSFPFSSTAPPPTEIYTLSLHDALPICHPPRPDRRNGYGGGGTGARRRRGNHSYERAPPSRQNARRAPGSDRKSTRLNSSHQIISYAVFCLKKKNTK